ncbi:MAG: type II methionyl aminopeptidase [Thermoproteales archaeon]|nr:type II methionyl aminopeptidase [Thermoproteales archaeon]
MHEEVFMLTDDEIEKYLKAGDIVHDTLNLALDVVKEGVSLLEIAEKLENNIVSKGGQPAFPVNISINEIAAHYSPAVNDTKIIPSKSIIKVDVGAHVDGYIADAAITISFSPDFDNLLVAAREALRNAESYIHPGKSLGSIGEVIEKVIRRYGFIPISNLNGHKIERYNLHAGKSVPNVSMYTFRKVTRDEVYAIEPFATNGEGFVIERENGHICQIMTMRRVKESKELNMFLKGLWRDFRSLPFAERWVYKKYGKRGLEDLERLISLKRVYRYNALVDRGAGLVSQFEDTMIVRENKVIVTTRVLELF